MKISTKFAIQYFLLQFGGGCIVPLLGLYYKQLNFTGRQIGVLFSLSTFAGLIVTPIWGAVVDKIGRIKAVILGLMSVSAFIFLIQAFITSYIGWVISIIFLYLFYSAINLLNDTWCLRQDVVYGKARRWGSIGFSAASLTTGLLTLFMDIRYFFFIQVFVLCIAIFSISKVKDVKVVKKDAKKKSGVKFDKRLVIFFIGTFFLAGTIYVNINYFGLLYVEAGGTTSGVGIVLFLSALSEVPVMSYVNKSIHKYGYEKLLMFITILSIMRWLWYGTRPGTIAILLTFFLHGLICGTFIPATLGYLRSIVDEERLAGTMGIYSSICTGISVLSFQYLGGYVMEKFSVSTVYTLFGIVCIVPLCCYFILQKLKCRQEELAFKM